VSAFGGVIALNAEVDTETATEIADYFVEVVIAPSVNPAAAEILADRKNLRVLEAPFASLVEWLRRGLGERPDDDEEEER
jgi:AICAR transformylase/IMP cyclohydrolase PurH